MDSFLKKFTVPELRKMVRLYNLDVKIVNYHKMRRDVLVGHIKKHIPTIEELKKYLPKPSVKKIEATKEKIEKVPEQVAKEVKTKLKPLKAVSAQKVEGPKPQKANEVIQKMKPNETNKKVSKESGNRLKIKINQVKPGDPLFIKNYKELSREEQIDILLKQSTITGNPLSREEYKDLAPKFYEDVFQFLKWSPYKALPKLVNEFSLTPNDLKNLWFGQTKGNAIDFYPTPKMCLMKLLRGMNSDWYFGDEGEDIKFLEGTAGLGSISFWIYEKYPKTYIQSNELNKNLFSLMNKFLPDEIDTTNKDFFHINRKDLDVIFLNPPFGENNNFLWVKFLLHGLNLLNMSKKNNKWLLFVSPRFYRSRQQYFDIFSIFKHNEGTVPVSTFLKYLNELNNTSFTQEDFEKAEETYSEGGDSLLYDLISEKYFFSLAEDIGDCEGFGGTNFKAQLTTFQIL